MESRLSLEVANAIVAEAICAAHNRGCRMNIAVVDGGGHLIAFARMDGAWKGSVDIAIKKARTAALFAMNTAVLDPLVRDGGSLHGIEHSNDGLICFPGGVVLPCGGAIGVSGDSVENDHAVAVAGRAVCKE